MDGIKWTSDEKEGEYLFVKVLIFGSMKSSKNDREFCISSQKCRVYKNSDNGCIFYILGIVDIKSFIQHKEDKMFICDFYFKKDKCN